MQNSYMPDEGTYGGSHPANIDAKNVLPDFVQSNIPQMDMQSLGSCIDCSSNYTKEWSSKVTYGINGQDNSRRKPLSTSKLAAPSDNWFFKTEIDRPPHQDVEYKSFAPSDNLLPDEIQPPGSSLYDAQYIQPSFENPDDTQFYPYSLSECWSTPTPYWLRNDFSPDPIPQFYNNPYLQTGAFYGRAIGTGSGCTFWNIGGPFVLTASHCDPSLASNPGGVVQLRWGRYGERWNDPNYPRTDNRGRYTLNPGALDLQERLSQIGIPLHKIITVDGIRATRSDKLDLLAKLMGVEDSDRWNCTFDNTFSAVSQRSPDRVLANCNSPGTREKTRDISVYRCNPKLLEVAIPPTPFQQNEKELVLVWPSNLFGHIPILPDRYRLFPTYPTFNFPLYLLAHNHFSSVRVRPDASGQPGPDELVGRTDPHNYLSPGLYSHNRYDGCRGPALYMDYGYTIGGSSGGAIMTLFDHVANKFPFPTDWIPLRNYSPAISVGGWYEKPLNQIISPLNAYGSYIPLRALSFTAPFSSSGISSLLPNEGGISVRTNPRDLLEGCSLDLYDNPENDAQKRENQAITKRNESLRKSRCIQQRIFGKISGEVPELIGCPNGFAAAGVVASTISSRPPQNRNEIRNNSQYIGNLGLVCLPYGLPLFYNNHLSRALVFASGSRDVSIQNSNANGLMNRRAAQGVPLNVYMNEYLSTFSNQSRSFSCPGFQALRRSFQQDLAMCPPGYYIQDIDFLTEPGRTFSEIAQIRGFTCRNFANNHRFYHRITIGNAPTSPIIHNLYCGSNQVLTGLSVSAGQRGGFFGDEILGTRAGVFGYRCQNTRS